LFIPLSTQSGNFWIHPRIRRSYSSFHLSNQHITGSISY